MLGTIGRAIVVGMVATIGWQPFTQTYQWTRDDGDVFRYKLEMNEDNRIKITVDYTPSSRSTAIAPRHAVNVVDFYKPCAVFDRDNFECHSVAKEDWIEMYNGILIHHYWGETRVFHIGD